MSSVHKSWIEIWVIVLSIKPKTVCVLLDFEEVDAGSVSSKERVWVEQTAAENWQRGQQIFLLFSFKTVF